MTILGKKLEEVECILHEVFRLPLDAIQHQRSSEEIKRRFVFLEKLLSKEIATSPESPRLLHVRNRLGELGTTFHYWEEHGEVPSKDQDRLESTVSTRSCTDYCVNDDWDANVDGETSLEADDMSDTLLYKEKAPEIIREERIGFVKRVGFGWFYGAVGTGVVIGMALMGFVLARLDGSLSYVDYPSYLVPT